jgi:hypothetical protein
MQLRKITERLRRFELYGDGHSHPSEEPRRQQASVLVFHMADMEVLMIPVDNAPYCLEADSSNYASGAVLSQKIDNKWHPVAYMSKALNETNRNYEIYNKEMLAIMNALSEWCQYLMGASEPFEIWTDHQNLQYFRKPQKLNRRQAHWMTELGEYHYSLVHKPRTTNVKLDILLRRPDLKRGEKNNKNILLLKLEHLRQQVFIFKSLDSDFLTRIKASSGARDRIVEKVLTGKEKGWQEHEEGVITWQERIYIPKNKRLWEDIIREHYDSIAAGHPGRYKTQELITCNYWWPYIQSDIRKYICKLHSPTGSCGLHVDSLWTPSKLLVYSIYSTWTPCGVHLKSILAGEDLQ